MKQKLGRIIWRWPSSTCDKPGKSCMQYFVTLVAVFILFSLCACLPSSARKNARLEQGESVALNAAFTVVDEIGRSPEEDLDDGNVILPGIDLQYASTFDDGSGIAVQLKTLLFILPSSLEVYYQLPDIRSNWYAGFGAQIGNLSGVYGVATRYINSKTYVTLTMRLLSTATVEEEKARIIYPQVSFGYDGAVDLSIFAAYGRNITSGTALFPGSSSTDVRAITLIGLELRY